MRMGTPITAGLLVLGTLVAVWTWMPDAALEAGGVPALRRDRVADGPPPGGARWKGADREARPLSPAQAPVPLQAEVPARPPIETLDAAGLRAHLEALVAELVDDDVRWNAATASRELKDHLRSARRRGPTAEVLGEALTSPDYQQRYFAATILWTDERGVPGPELLDTTVEMLTGCRWSGDPRALAETNRNLVRPVNGAVRYLLRHAEAAESRLLPLLDQREDDDTRFLAAFVLARGGRRQRADRLIVPLIERLRDNDVGQDAIMAMNALVSLGDRALHWLELDRPVDAQHDACRKLLLRRLRSGRPVPKAETRELNVVTDLMHDPTDGWSFRWYASRRW